MEIHYYPQGVVFQKTSEFLVNLLMVNRGKKILLLLSGGSAVKLYDRIAYYVSSIKYENLAIGQIDERYRPNFQFSIFNFQSISNNQNINATQIWKTGLWKSCEMKGIPYYLVSQKGNLQESAEGYNKILEKLFKEYTYKIGILGIGEDVHTAGLLPGYKSAWAKKQFALGYENKGRFPSRITLTPNSLEQLDQTIVVASGEGKRIAIKNAFDPANIDNLDKYPAVIIQKIKKVDLFTDLTL